MSVLENLILIGEEKVAEIENLLNTPESASYSTKKLLGELATHNFYLGYLRAIKQKSNEIRDRLEAHNSVIDRLRFAEEPTTIKPTPPPTLKVENGKARKKPALVARNQEIRQEIARKNKTGLKTFDQQIGVKYNVMIKEIYSDSDGYFIELNDGYYIPQPQGGEQDFIHGENTGDAIQQLQNVKRKKQ